METPIPLIGTAPAFKKALARADKMAGCQARVLILGETGTGKEKFARYIHDQSARKNQPFIALNCASLSPELLESELFGHVKGAFTSALREHRGLVASAGGGTLFLDEIGELALPQQAKLLRFIDTGEFRKLGSTAIEKADVRIIAATHRDLEARAASHVFRQDLYFRLAVLTLPLPPLRARQEDIIPLAESFLHGISAAENHAPFLLADDARAALLAAPWPGNIRELQNTLHQAALMCSGNAITAAALNLTNAEGKTADPLQQLRAAASPQPLWRVEEAAIAAALDYCRGNIPKAAGLLEISPSTLYRRLQATGGAGSNTAATRQHPEFEQGF